MTRVFISGILPTEKYRPSRVYLALIQVYDVEGSNSHIINIFLPFFGNFHDRCFAIVGILGPVVDFFALLGAHSASPGPPNHSVAWPHSM